MRLEAALAQLAKRATPPAPPRKHKPATLKGRRKAERQARKKQR